jgi:uncharacterized protein
MKTDLSYLPAHKQAELAQIVAAIGEIVPVEMIILFGSYARNAYVEDWIDETRYRYLSDYDLLVIVKTKSEIIQSKFERDIKNKIAENKTIRTPVSVIVHDIEFVNRRLKKAQYFFTDIKREGILLYDSKKYKLSESKELHPNERKKLAQDDYDHFFGKVEEFIKYFKIMLSDESYNLAAFTLHQATEQLYSGILLVLTRYKPNTHDIANLRSMTNSLDIHFSKAFPLENEEQEKQFELLRKAYVHARYNRAYVITKEELLVLYKQVEQLKEIGAVLCREKIESFPENNK